MAKFASERKFGVKSKVAMGAFVRELTFSDTGVNMTFTQKECFAARVSSREVAEAIAVAALGGTVCEVSKKATVEDVLEDEMK